MSTSRIPQENGRVENKTLIKINAFQFMMNSRHKVIGSNSPGKERKDCEIKSPEDTERTKDKLSKRKAVFESWAEKKGGTKRKIIDEAAEKHINTTLRKRAKRLKKMLAIIDDELKNSGEECSDSEEVVNMKYKERGKPVIDSETINDSDDNKDVNSNTNQTEFGNYKTDENKNENELINAEEGKQANVESIEQKTTESPRIEQKICENISLESGMEADKLNVENKLENKENEKLNQVMESKTSLKKRSYKKKNSLSLRKNEVVIEDQSTPKENENKYTDEFSNDEIFPLNVEDKSDVAKKTPRPCLLTVYSNFNKINEDENKVCFSPRTWRMKLRPAEDVNNDNDNESRNSDENSVYSQRSENKETDSSVDEIGNSKCIEYLKDDDECITSKYVKIAPIFLRQQQKKLEKEALAAKRKFLHSGVPVNLKKLMAKSDSFQETEYIYNLFPKVSHVQQKNDDEFSNILWNLPEIDFNFTKSESGTVKLLFDEIHIGSFTTCKSLDNNINASTNHISPTKYENLKEIVTELKQEYPSYPIYKTFRLFYQKYEKYGKTIEKNNDATLQKQTSFKPKRGRPKKKKEIQKLPESTNFKQKNLPQLETLMWTEKYKPQSQEEIIGNTQAVQELKSWLESWIRYSEDQKSRKRRQSNSSDDFCSDNTSKDSDYAPQNLTVVFGPFGSGKTSSIYGLCNELSINIIEINASSKRPGRKILADLLEATQSHQVKNTDSKSVTSFFRKKPDSQSEDDVNKKLSLLLFEDVDIVFEDQDESFISALSTLTLSSKRPIILTSTDKNCPHLQKFVLQYSVVQFKYLSIEILSPWLQILCLIEGVRADKGMIDKLIQFNKGDVRKMLLQLQFWVQTGGDPSTRTLEIKESLNETKMVQEISSDQEIFVDDENSDMLWLTQENNCVTDKINYIHHQNCLELFIPYFEKDVKDFKLAFPVNSEILWWNIPEILDKNYKTNKNIFKCYNQNNIYNNTEESIEAQDNKSSPDNLNTALSFLENLAILDCVHTHLKIECYEEPIYKFWQINPENSLSLDQNSRMYSETHNTSLEIAHWLVQNTAKLCQNDKNNEAQDVNISSFYLEELSWRSKRHRAIKELLNAIPVYAILDRKAICEDYLPMLRTISRSESDRIATSNKRKNRFYHYFKNLNIHVNDSIYTLLCNTLATN